MFPAFAQVRVFVLVIITLNQPSAVTDVKSPRQSDHMNIAVSTNNGIDLVINV